MTLNTYDVGVFVSPTDNSMTTRSGAKSLNAVLNDKLDGMLRLLSQKNKRNTIKQHNVTTKKPHSKQLVAKTSNSEP